MSVKRPNNTKITRITSYLRDRPNKYQYLYSNKRRVFSIEKAYNYSVKLDNRISCEEIVKV